MEKKLQMCFVDLENAFDRVPWNALNWAMRKRGIPEVLVLSVISMYEGVTTRVIVDSELSEEFEVKVGMHQGSVLSSFVCSCGRCCHKFAREGALSELLYADDSVLSSETIDGLGNVFLQ